MKAIQLASFGIIPATLFTIACGDDVTKVTKIEKTSGMEVVASADSLGKCTEEISGEMKFASKENAVYICADSAWKNVSEAENASCSAETLADGSGFKIVCGGDSVGVVKNGEDGKAGAEGDAGKDGANGEGCKLAEGPVLEEGNSLVQTSFVVCGKDTVGTISDGRPGENCELADNGDGTVSVVCGDASSTLYKALCGGKVYNPDSNFCFADSIVPLCGGESYDLDESFCVADSVVSLCDGKIYDLDSSFCSSGLVVPQSKKLVWNLMNPEIEYGLFTDSRDGQIYRSVKIGEQTWMAENLNYETVGSYCYNDSSENCQKYGRLYGFIPANVLACPEGWHLPDTTEFNALAAAIGGMEITGKSLKSMGGWEYDGGGLDNYGFSALPAGMRYGEDDFDELGYTANFCSATNKVDSSFVGTGGLSTTILSNEAYLLSLNFSSDIADLKYVSLNYAFSVRCVED